MGRLETHERIPTERIVPIRIARFHVIAHPKIKTNTSARACCIGRGCPDEPINGRTDNPIDPDAHPGAILVEGRKCTSMTKHFEDISTKHAQLTAYQEVSAPDTSIDALKARLTKAGWASDFSPCCPEAGRPTASVATCVRQPGNATEIEQRQTAA